MKKLVLFLGMLSASVLAAPSLDHFVFDTQSQTVSLNEFKGKVVYVDFWAS